MKLAAQLYTLRDYTATADSFREVLKRCREIGYDGVQLSAVGCMSGDQPQVDATAARNLLDEFDLTCCATHRPWTRLANDTREEIEFHRILACDYLAVGSIGGDFGDTAESYRSFLTAAEPVAKTFASAGIRFGYHNHSHEFIRDPETKKPCYDQLMAAGWLQLEIDTYWLAHAGICSESFLKRASGRIAAVHLKDMEVVPKDGPVMAPVGEGNLDWPAILVACQAGGTEWLIVEQDVCRRDPFDCLAASHGFLTSLLRETR